jgi:hypothetical protein
MWQAIAYVGSGVTLAAFFAAVAAWVFRQRIIQVEHLIRTAPEESRGPLVERALEVVGIDASKLTRQQRFDIAMAQIHNRAVRYRTTAWVISILAILAASVVAFAIWRGSRADEVLEQIKQTTAKLDNLVDMFSSQINRERQSESEKKTIEAAARAITRGRTSGGYEASIRNGPRGLVFRLQFQAADGAIWVFEDLANDDPDIVKDALRKMANSWPAFDIDLPGLRTKWTEWTNPFPP